MNVFVIQAPYQILNAIEAVHHYNFRRNTLVIPLNGLFPRQGFEIMIDREQWDRVQFLSFYSRLKNFDFGKNRPRNVYERILELFLTFDQSVKKMRMETLARSVGRVENLILGSYQDSYDLHMRHLANMISHENLYLIDVGTDTLKINRQRNEEIRLRQTSGKAETRDIDSGGMLLRAKRALKRNLVEWNAEGVDRLTYFTCYELIATGQDRVERNSYAHARSLVSKADVDGNVWFIAQTLVDEQYLSLDTYLEYLRKVKEYFSGRKIVYVPHPRESERYVSVVEKTLGFEIRRFDGPIEYEVAYRGRRPQCIASFFSSALENCAAISGDILEIRSFQINENDLLKYKDVVGEVYSYFSSSMDNNIEVVRL